MECGQLAREAEGTDRFLRPIRDSINSAALEANLLRRLHESVNFVPTNRLPEWWNW